MTKSIETLKKEYDENEKAWHEMYLKLNKKKNETRLTRKEQKVLMAPLKPLDKAYRDSKKAFFEKLGETVDWS